MTDVVMPQMGESIVEGTLTKWLKKPGDHVERDEPLFEISTDKVDTEIPSPAAGTLSEVMVEEGKTVGISTVVARIDEVGRTPSPLRPAPEACRRRPATGAGSSAHPHSRPSPRSCRIAEPAEPPARSPRWCAAWRASIPST
jgi:pyruvate dehydrogenase E2 component (dihydrolipoamide acetyltransferase)